MSSRLTTGGFISRTRCSAASTSTTGTWPSCTPKRPRTAFASSSSGAASLTGRADRKMSQRAFGGHTHRRLVHIGDRTGLELIRTLQDKAVHSGSTCSWNARSPACSRTASASAAPFGYRRATGEFIAFATPALVLATGGAGKCWRTTSNSWECMGDGQALAYEAGAELVRHGVRPVSPHRDGLAARCHRPARHRGRPRRGRDPAQRRRRAIHGAIRPQAARALDARCRRPLDLYRGQGGTRAHHMAACSSTSRTCRPRPSGAGCRACTTSSSSSPASTSLAGRWRSVRRATTSWAGSASTRRPARAPSRVCSPPASARVG